MPRWHSGSVLAGDVRLQTYRTGGGGPPLVLAHGITDAGLCWSPIAEQLAEQYDIVMYDARGHGRSDAPPDGYTQDDYAADLVALVQALGLEQPAVVGHSMGATVAAAAAARSPQTFRRLVLEDPPWNPPAAAPQPGAENWFEEWRARSIAMKSKSREELLALGKAQSPRWFQAEFEPWVEAKQQVNPVIFNGIRTIGQGWREIVPGISCPALLITGDPELGAIVRPDVASEVRALNPLIEVFHIGGTGHNIRREGHEAFLGAVMRFFANGAA